MTIDWNNLALLLGLCCVLPAIALVIASIVALRQGQRWLTPDFEQLQKRFDALRASNPGTDARRFVQQIIHRQALRAGLVGAVTSVGGVWVLPFGLVIDLYASARIQSATMHFLAWANGIRDEDRVLRIGQMLALPSLDRVQVTPEMLMNWQTRLSSRVYRAMAVTVLEKSFAKLIPGLGLILGFAINYLSARLFATAANEYYAGTLARLLGPRMGPALPPQ